VLTGHFGQRLKRDSSFTKFMHCLIESLKSVGISLIASLSDSHLSHLLFSDRMINSIAINTDDELSRITDRVPDVERANSVA
jgi:hypothetical protein